MWGQPPRLSVERSSTSTPSTKTNSNFFHRIIPKLVTSDLYCEFPLRDTGQVRTGCVAALS